jgi:RimJ/RimL family protein N-acetyltransferase
MKLVHNSIYLKRPTVEELHYTEMLLACKDTMAFNNKWGGTVPFPKEKWASFHERYCTSKPDKEYFHIYNLDHIFVGEVSTRFDTTYDSFVLNIKILHRYRGNHHAKDALELFLEYVFVERDIDRIIDDVAIDNEAAISFLHGMGFTKSYTTDEAVIMELTKDAYFS